MIIETNIGNFGSFEDLEKYMRTEKHDKVVINKANCFGINWKILKNLELTYEEVLKTSQVK